MDAIRFSLFGVCIPHSTLSKSDSVVVVPSSEQAGGFKMEGSSTIMYTLLGVGVSGLLGELTKNAGKGTGLGETSNLESFSARFGVNSPRDDSSASAFLLAALTGVDRILLALGDGISVSDWLP